MSHALELRMLGGDHGVAVALRDLVVAGFDTLTGGGHRADIDWYW